MSERTPRLSDDTRLMLGCVERQSNGYGLHRVHTFSYKQMEDAELTLCGFRGDWAIVFGDYDEKWVNQWVKPMLCAGSAKQVQAAQMGTPISTSPVIWHVPSHSRLT